VYSYNFLRARRTGFYHGVGAPTTPTVRAPVLHFPRAGIPNLERLALSGWGDAGFQAVVNFRFTEF
jgi:hypothetical protein